MADKTRDELNGKAVSDITELEKYWKAVKDNPQDFTVWTYLLQHVEQADEVINARKAFDEFLKRYPFCYGYWKKYGDFEKKHENMEEAEAVFERGVDAIPMSVDLWLHFVTFLSAKYDKDPRKKDKLSIVFSKAIDTAGMDFRSDRLWDACIDFEVGNGNVRKVLSLYDRLLDTPTYYYNQHYDRFIEFVNENNPKDFLELDEYLKLRKELFDKEAVNAVIADEGGDAPVAQQSLGDVSASQSQGDVAPPGSEPKKSSDNPDLNDVKDDEQDVTMLRKRIIEIRDRVHSKNVEEVGRRWTFEDAIRRPYFHSKPLERAQLKNWKDYLEYDMKSSSHSRIVALFERCIIACCLYEEFWLKYCDYSDSHSVEDTRGVYKRACTIHLPTKPTIHVAWAAFEERHGDSDKALEILQSLDSNVPGLVSVAVRMISLQRRRGNYEKVDQLFKERMLAATTNDVRSFFAIKYARYQAKIVGNTGVAKSILEDALVKDPANHKIYLQLIDQEFQRTIIDESAIIRLFDRAVEGPLLVEHKIAFSQRRLEFLEDFSSSINRIQEAYQKHQVLLKENHQNSMKRQGTETSGIDEGPAEKRVKPVDPSILQQTPVVVPPPVQNFAYPPHVWANAYNGAGGQFPGYPNATGYQSIPGYPTAPGYQNTWPGYQGQYYPTS